MSNHFDDLLLQTLKEINVRLDRLEGRVDHVIDRKADQTALDAIHAKLQAALDAVHAKLDVHGKKLDALEKRLDRIDGGIGTLKWVIGAEVAVIGIILAFIKTC